MNTIPKMTSGSLLLPSTTRTGTISEVFTRLLRS
jgi:hypothetical protein